MRQFELGSLENSNTATFLFLENMDDHTVKSISPILNDVQAVLEKATDELLQHLYQLKHSEKYVLLSVHDESNLNNSRSSAHSFLNLIFFSRKFFYRLINIFFSNFPHRYADVLAEKLQQKVTAVRKIEATRTLLKAKIEQFKEEKASIQPLVGKLTEQTKILQNKVC